jgi:hypothetical protein
MGVSGRNKTNGDHNMKLFRLCPFWQTATNSSSSSSTQNLNHSHKGSSNSVRHVAVNSSGLKSTTVSSVARSLLPAPRRLRLDPANNLYFPCTLRFNLLPVDFHFCQLFFFCYFYCLIYFNINYCYYYYRWTREASKECDKVKKQKQVSCCF